jgi:hypothetical protein
VIAGGTFGKEPLRHERPRSRRVLGLGAAVLSRDAARGPPPKRYTWGVRYRNVCRKAIMSSASRSLAPRLRIALSGLTRLPLVTVDIAAPTVLTT